MRHAGTGGSGHAYASAAEAAAAAAVVASRPPELCSLLDAMLQREPERRPSAEQVMEVVQRVMEAAAGGEGREKGAAAEIDEHAAAASDREGMQGEGVEMEM